MDPLEEGCLCEEGNVFCCISKKCDKCFTRKGVVLWQDGCSCTFPSFFKTAHCGNCSRRNNKYVRAARIAAGAVIAQHFLAEWQPHQKGVTNMTDRKNRRNSCNECYKTAPSDRLKKRFGETPKAFRSCLEKKILRALVVIGGENPNEAVAKEEAEKRMHEWMDNEVELVQSRRRRRNKHDTETKTDWFENYYNPNTTLTHIGHWENDVTKEN